MTLADLPHNAFKFLKFLCDKYKLGIKFQACTTDYSDLKGEYDYIICSDVLEHTDEPEEALKALMKLLKDDGWFFLATFFDDCQGTDPSHLRKNVVRYGNYQNWLGKVLQLGLVLVESDKHGIEKGYKKRTFIKKILDKY